MSTETESEELSDQTAEEPDAFDGKTCTTCGEKLSFVMEVGPRAPLVLKGCGCGLALEYSPTSESGGPCPVCELIREHDLGDLGTDFTHTHVQSVPVWDPRKTDPIADTGPRPLTGVQLRALKKKYANEDDEGASA